MLSGRSSLYENEEDLATHFDILRWANLTWTDIGLFLDICRQTVINIRLRINYVDGRVFIWDDDDLDDLVFDLIQDCRERGWQLIIYFCRLNKLIRSLYIFSKCRG